MSYSTYPVIFGGFSVQPIATASYKLLNEQMCHVVIYTSVDGVSNQAIYDSLKFTLPFKSAPIHSHNGTVSLSKNNDTLTSTLGRVTIFPNSNVGYAYINPNLGNSWTAGGLKSIQINILYQIRDTSVFESNDSVGARPAIISWGQSNLGTGVTHVETDLEVEYQQLYRYVRFYKYSLTQSVEVAGMNWENNATYQTPDQNTAYSLQFYLYPQIQALVNRNLYVVHHGAGDTSLVADWKASSPVGVRYGELLFKTLAIKAKINQLDGVDPAFKLLLIVHGEKDGRVLADANNYQDNLTTWINGFRTHTGLSNIPVIIVKLNTESITAPSNPVTYAATIRAAQDAVALALTNIYIVDPNGATMHTDKIHYSVAGEKTIADRIMTVINANNLMA